MMVMMRCMRCRLSFVLYVVRVHPVLYRNLMFVLLSGEGLWRG